MNEAIKLILSLSLSASILFLLILAVKPFMKHRLSKTVQYYIWIVVILRLVVPFSFENSIINDVFYNEEKPAVVISNNDLKPINKTDAVSINSSSSTIHNATYNNDIDIDHSRYFNDLFNRYVMYIWMLGVIIVLTVNISGYIRFLKYLRKGYKPVKDIEKILLSTLLKGRRNVRLLRNEFISTPMLIGIIRPCIIIPDGDFDEVQLKNILLHEITHLNHFDVGIKWLTMIATSIHWFNPLIHFIRKEIDKSCELACDEKVIKNFTQNEKQVYGDTLISFAENQKYPIGVLQVTMCEEKKSLKERLVAIMKHNRKSKLIIAFSVILLASVVLGALYLGGGIGREKNIPPNIYISSEREETKTALMGSYSWKSGDKHIEADSSYLIGFKYMLDNIISVAAKDELIIDTQKLDKDKLNGFTLEYMAIYKEGEQIGFETEEPSFMNGSLHIQAPSEAGEYIYVLILNFEDRGTVSYGFVVRVDMMSYDLSEISKYKTPYVGDSSKVTHIADLLPVPDNYFKHQYISIKSNNKPYNLTIYYEAAADMEYEGEWPITKPGSVIETNSRTNALVVFSMIDNLDEVTFAFFISQSDGELDDSKYNTTYTFQRAAFEEKHGDLSMLGNDIVLLEDLLAGKESAMKGLELYVWRDPELTGNNNLYYTLLMGTNRNKSRSEVYDMDIATSDLKVIKQKLSMYSSGTYFSIMHSSDIDKETMIGIGDDLTGIIKNASLSIGGVDFNDRLTVDTEIDKSFEFVENNLTIIMSSPKESSNPMDYIKAHQNEYENIIKYGNEEVLEYLLSQFENNNVEGLRGQLIMRICKELLGQRNNVIDESLSPMEWSMQLDMRQEIILPDFSYDGTDLIEKLVYETEIEMNKSGRGGFTIVAPKIFGSYEEENKLKVFATTFTSSYRLYGNILSNESGGIVPVAITYIKNSDGSYSLEEYNRAMDGSYFGSSIKEFCTMPVSGKNINGLADEILDHYGDYEDIRKLKRENLIKHLNVNNQYGVYIYEKHYDEPSELIPLN